MLLGCYRTGEANDPEVYIAATVRVLSSYPIEVARSVVDPVTGIPGRVKWLPTIAEVREACEDTAQRATRLAAAVRLPKPEAKATTRKPRQLEEAKPELRGALDRLRHGLSTGPPCG